MYLNSKMMTTKDRHFFLMMHIGVPLPMDDSDTFFGTPTTNFAFEKNHVQTTTKILHNRMDPSFVKQPHPDKQPKYGVHRNHLQEGLSNVVQLETHSKEPPAKLQLKKIRSGNLS